MKIAVTGKGGVGKTTFAGMLCRVYSSEGKRVVAVDADPDANLGSAIGLSLEDMEKIMPITSMSELIEERTGVPRGSSGTVFRLNPKVDDIPEIAGKEFENIRLLTMGKSKEGGSGCYCPENSLLRRLVNHLVLETEDVIIMDTEAGIEHISRGTAEGVDCFVIVVEPGKKSMQTAKTIINMAKSIGIKEVFLVANKVNSSSEFTAIQEEMKDTTILGWIPYDSKVVAADLRGETPYDNNPELVNAITKIKDRMEALATGSIMT